MFTKAAALKDIDETQSFYVQQLADLLTEDGARFGELKEIDFTSPTGTGKTIMVAKLINLLPQFFFVVTTLSRGQLKIQIERKLAENVTNGNFIVYGLNDFTRNTRLQEKEINSSIDWEKKVIWIRDEGHIATNRWAEILEQKAHRIVNFSATNKSNRGIQCNFTHTMMLRTVTQSAGTPEEALDKLLEVKQIHKSIPTYNPCALFRILNEENLKRVERACRARALRFINITDEAFDMSQLCEDDNEYDVIINKFKITEGIDLRRCHVIYMDTKPENEATVVQVIGRARRNALFWRKDIDILKPALSKLLKETRRCFVFYNVPETQIATNASGEFLLAMCDTVSIEALKPGITVRVEDGRMPNGLKLLELEGQTGVFHISLDREYNCNVVDNPVFYSQKKVKRDNFIIDMESDGLSLTKIFLKPNVLDFFFYDGYRGEWKYDPQKYWFYIWREYSKEQGFPIDFDYWASYLQMDRKDLLISKKAFSQFCHSEEVKKLRRDREEKGIKTSETLRLAAQAFCKKGPSRIPVEKKNIFAKNQRSRSLTLSSDFLPYVDSIEYYDVTVEERIRELVRNSKNIQFISLNSYRVTNHPKSSFLISKGYRTFKSFKQMVMGATKATIYSAKTAYWKKALAAVKTYAQLDRYDSQIIDLKTLNRKLKIGLSDDELFQLANNGKILKSCSGAEMANIEFVWFRPDGSFEHIYSRQKLIYRDSFCEKYVPYEKTFNDREIAILGPDTMTYSRGAYHEDRPVTSKITKHTKFLRFLLTKYQKELEKVEDSLFSGENKFSFDRKCNSCLGFCVEYFAKIRLYGDSVFQRFINLALSESKDKEITDLIRVRAAMLIYKEEMQACYGTQMAGIIPQISLETLLKKDYRAFVQTVIDLGNRTADFVKSKFGETLNETRLYDPVLSVNHITALADFISKDTILELKCTSSITKQNVLQVLAYHYLSSKRTDLQIRRLIVYEAVTNRFVEIGIQSIDSTIS